KVADVAVVGVRDERTGEAVEAWVAPRAGEQLGEQEILDFLHGYLARFKWPKEVRIVEEVPRNTTGKLLRRAFRSDDVLGRSGESCTVWAGAGHGSTRRWSCWRPRPCTPV